MSAPDDFDPNGDPWAQPLAGKPDRHPRIIDLSPWLDGNWDVDESLLPKRPTEDDKDDAWAAQVNALVALLDGAGVPKSYSADRLRAYLRAERPHVAASNEALSAAVKVRRAGPDGPPDGFPARPGNRRFGPRVERDQWLIAWVANLKLDAGCADCGYNAHPRALDFDHIRGPKLGSVGAMARMPDMTREQLQAEIDKCEVVCANCHRIRTDNRRR